MPVNNFYTYFDHKFLCRGLALYRSIKRCGVDFNLYILCLDDITYEMLNKLSLEKTVLIKLEALEQSDHQLAFTKIERSKIEFYFTCTASFGCYLFNYFEDIQFLTYLDADTYFYANPDKVIEELQNASIAITPHRFPESKKHNERFGIYNVGWVSFRRDEEGIACIEKWREDCLTWCGNYLDQNQFGDQKYLDAWPTLFKRVRIIEHYGINAAPWNLENAEISLRGKAIFINQDPLVLYHFHSLSRLIWQIYKLGLQDYGVNKNKIIWQEIYLPYIKEVNSIYEELQEESLPLYGIGSKQFSFKNFLKKSDLLLNFTG